MNARTFFLLSFIIVSLSICAQKDELNDPIGYRFDRSQTNVHLYGAGADGKVDMNVVRLINHRTQFSMGPFAMVPNGGDTLVQIFIYGTPQQPPAFRGLDLDRGDFGKYFWMRKKEFDGRAKHDVYSTRIWAFTLGIISMPVTYRPARGHLAPIFDGATNINTSLGLKTRLSSSKAHFIMPFMAAGIQGIKMNSANNSAISDPDKNENVFAFLIGGGLTLDINGAQFGVMLGTDLATGDMGTTYHYDGAPWIGINLGASLLDGALGKGDGRQ